MVLVYCGTSLMNWPTLGQYFLDKVLSAAFPLFAWHGLFCDFDGGDWLPFTFINTFAYLSDVSFSFLFYAECVTSQIALILCQFLWLGKHNNSIYTLCSKCLPRRKQIEGRLLFWHQTFIGFYISDSLYTIAILLVTEKWVLCRKGFPSWYTTCCG